MNEVIDTILKRRSIRKYQDRPVEPEKLELLLQAAMAAPSAVNSQPWEFIVVTDPTAMNGLREKLPYGKHNAPAAIVVCGSPLHAKNPAAQLFWVQDCSAALENILVAAVSLGLGTVWIGGHPTPTAQSIRKALGIPAYVIPLGVVYVGYPAEEKEARTQYEEKKVFWQRYGGKK